MSQQCRRSRRPGLCWGPIWHFCHHLQQMHWWKYLVVLETGALPWNLSSWKKRWSSLLFVSPPCLETSRWRVRGQPWSVRPPCRHQGFACVQAAWLVVKLKRLDSDGFCRGALWQGCTAFWGPLLKGAHLWTSWLSLSLSDMDWERVTDVFKSRQSWLYVISKHIREWKTRILPGHRSSPLEGAARGAVGCRPWRCSGKM